MDLLKTFAKALLWGAGLGLGVTAAFFATRSFWMGTSPDYRLDRQHLAALEVLRQKVFIKDGRLAVTGAVVNHNDAPVQQLTITSVVTEKGRPLERCSTFTTYGKLIKPNEEMEFVSFCTNQWSAVAEDALAVQTEVQTAFEEFSTQRK